MHQGKLVFAPLMLFLPLGTFRRCVAEDLGFEFFVGLRQTLLLSLVASLDGDVAFTCYGFSP